MHPTVRTGTAQTVVNPPRTDDDLRGIGSPHVPLNPAQNRSGTSEVRSCRLSCLYSASTLTFPLPDDPIDSPDDGAAMKLPSTNSSLLGDDAKSGRVGVFAPGEFSALLP